MKRGIQCVTWNLHRRRIYDCKSEALNWNSTRDTTQWSVCVCVCVNNLISTKQHINIMIYFRCTCILFISQQIIIDVAICARYSTRKMRVNMQLLRSPRKCHAPKNRTEFSVVATSCTQRMRARPMQRAHEL